MTVICDVCGKKIKDTSYDFSVTKRYSFKSYHCCSHSCWLAAAQFEGLTTIPEKSHKTIRTLRIITAINLATLTLSLLLRILLPG